MSNAIQSLSTSGMSPKAQIQRWTDALTELCGKFDVDPLGASSLEGRVAYTTVSRLKLCQIELSQHRIAHTSARARFGEHPYVKILFQTYGISHFEQGGRRIELSPGDCFAYDVSIPHTIISPATTRHEVAIVPTELLRERGFQPAKMPVCKLSARTGAGRIAHDFVHAAFGEAPRLQPHTATGVADTLINLLLLPLRELGTVSNRAGPEALHVRALAFIHEHLRDPDLSIDQIADALGCTKRYLHVIFHDRGTTVSDYIWHARLQNCRQELETGSSVTITDTAFSWGFSSSSHFSRVFRRHFGIAPSAVHRAHHKTTMDEV